MDIDHRYIKNIGTHTHPEIDAFMDGGGSVRPYTFVVDVNGDGDFTTITEALDELGTDPGSIKIREGTYLNETDPFPQRNGQWIIGSGFNTVIKPPASISGNGVFEMTATGGLIDDQAIMNLRIDGSLTSNVIDGIYAGDSTDSGSRIIENVLITGMKGRGATLLSGGVWSLSKIRFLYNKRTGLFVGAGSDDNAAHGIFNAVGAEYNGIDNVVGNNYGIQVYNAQAVMFRNCFSEVNKGNNFHAYTDTELGQYMTQLLLEGCLFEVADNGQEVYIENYLDVRLIGNFALANGVGGSYGYKLKGCKHVSITGNEAHNGYYGYYLQNCENVVAAGNLDRDCIIPIYVTGGNRLSLTPHSTNNTNSILVLGTVPTNSVAMYNDSAGSPRNLSLVITDAEGAMCIYKLYTDGSIGRSVDAKTVQWA